MIHFLLLLLDINWSFFIMNNQVSNSPYPCKELENIRVRRQLLSYLSTDKHPLNINIVHDPEAFMREVRRLAYKELGPIWHRGNILNDWLKKETLTCKAELLPESEFDWLKHDERACYYTWLILQGYYPLIQSLTNFALDKKGNWLSYNTLELSTLAESSQKRLELVVGYFDLQPVAALDKINYLKRLREQWNNDFERNPFKWLDRKDKSACEWGYEYIVESFKAVNPESKGRQRTLHNAHESHHELLSNIKPSTPDEMYQFIYAFFDIMDEQDKKDLKEKISRKFAQHKYQKSKQEMPPLNTRMSKETKKQLEKLRKHYKTNLQDTIEHIIQLAYDHEIIKSNVIKVDFSKKD